MLLSLICYQFIAYVFSVSTKGEKYLNSAGPDCQPPLYLPIPDNMDEEEGGESGQVEGLKPLSSECEGLSEVGKVNA